MFYQSPQKLLRMDGPRVTRLFKDFLLKNPEKKADNVFKAAIKLVDEYQGIIPSEKAQLKRFQGIGDHTASVIMALAFNKNEFGVDTHVRRVLKRIGTVDQKTNDKDIVKYVSYYNPDRLGDLSRSIMEFGRDICKYSPRCNNCPLAQDCHFNQEDLI